MVKIEYRYMIPVIVAIVLIVIGVSIVYGTARNTLDTDSDIILGGLGFLKPAPYTTSRNIFLTVKKKQPAVRKTIKRKPVQTVIAKPKAENTKNLDKASVFEYVGYLMKYGRDEAFIVKGEEMYVVKRGDMLSNDLKVLSISREQVKLRSESRNELLILNMNENTE